MRSKQSTTYDKKGFIKRIDLKIYPEELTLKSSKNGCLYLLDAIREALIKDNKKFHELAKINENKKGG